MAPDLACGTIGVATPTDCCTAEGATVSTQPMGFERPKPKPLQPANRYKRQKIFSSQHNSTLSDVLFSLAMIAKGPPLPMRGAALGQCQQVLRELSIGTTGSLAARGVREGIRYASGAG